MTAQDIKVLVVSEEGLARQGLGSVLQGKEGLDVRGGIAGISCSPQELAGLSPGVVLIAVEKLDANVLEAVSRIQAGSLTAGGTTDAEGLQAHTLPSPRCPESTSAPTPQPTDTPCVFDQPADDPGGTALTNNVVAGQAPLADVLEGKSDAQTWQQFSAIHHKTPKPYKEVELLIPPPVDAHRLLLMTSKLREQYYVEVVQAVGSWEGGTQMRLRSRESLDVKGILSQMAEVAQVWETRAEVKSFLTRTVPQFCNAREPDARLHLILKTADESVQLSLPV
ncbi:MAG: hypothetical protein V3U95_06395 [Dehalococcoidia bacterium]